VKKTKDNMRDIVREFLEGAVQEKISLLSESSPIDAQAVMARFIDSNYGPAARVGSKEWKEADAARKVKDAQTAAEQQEPLPKDKLDAEIKRLRHLMQQHDWYYKYSDDHRVWAAGNKEDGMIRGLAKQLRKRGHTSEVEELYKQHDPRKKSKS